LKTDELRGIIAKNRTTQSKLAQKLGITPKTFYEKMKKGVFGSDEISIMIKELKIDDPVGACSVHGANGMWGVLSVGLFADGTYGGVKGLLFGGGWGQLGAQAVGILALWLVIFPLAFMIFKIIDKTMGLRVSAKDELMGLDMPVHGALCYPEFALSSLGVPQSFPGEDKDKLAAATKSISKGV
jgi:Amt family ammonium transporter